MKKSQCAPQHIFCIKIWILFISSISPAVSRIVRSGWWVTDYVRDVKYVWISRKMICDWLCLTRTKPVPSAAFMLPESHSVRTNGRKRFWKQEWAVGLSPGITASVSKHCLPFCSNWKQPCSWLVSERQTNPPDLLCHSHTPTYSVVQYTASGL